jgi:hypothetical protein
MNYELSTMNPLIFLPPRRQGLILHIGAALVLAGVDAVSFFYAAQQAVGSYFVLLLLLSLALLAPLIFVFYRGYALMQARYSLERDGLRLRWGLRAEDIPLPEVEWVRPASDLAFRLPLPFLPTPGSILGTINVPDLGPVEFMAADLGRMLLVATPHKVYAISPADPQSFVAAFQRVVEMGSLSPLPPATTLPAAYLQSVWSDRPARILSLIGLLLTVALFVVVGLAIPSHASIALGWSSSGLPVKPGPPERLLLLPVLGTFTYVLDLMIGLYLYRFLPLRPVSFLLWVGSVITPILLIVAVVYMV